LDEDFQASVVGGGEAADRPGGRQPGVEVAELCRREGIKPTMYYGWKKQLLSSAGKIIDARSGRPPTQQERREAEMRRMKDVIAEITAVGQGKNRE
jgi:transposase-like protein